MLDDAITQYLSNAGVKDVSDMFKKAQNIFKVVLSSTIFLQQEVTLPKNMMNTVITQPPEHQTLK